MTPPELRELWRELFGALPPQVNRAYLQRRLAYRIQELAMGGGSDAIDKRLDTLDKQKHSDRAQKSSRYLKIAPGTKLRSTSSSAKLRLISTILCLRSGS